MSEVVIEGLNRGGEIILYAETWPVNPEESVPVVQIGTSDGGLVLDAAHAVGLAAALVDKVLEVDPSYDVAGDLLAWCLTLELATGVGPPLEKAGAAVQEKLVAAAVRLRLDSEPRWKRRLRRKGR